LRIERRLLASIQPAAPDLALTVLLGLVGALLTIGQAFLLSRIVTGIFLEEYSSIQVIPLLLRWSVLALLRIPVRVARAACAQAGASAIKGRLRGRLTAALVRLGPQWLSNQRSGELLTSLTEGMEALDAYIGGYLPQLAWAAIIPLLLLAFLMPIDLISALVLLFTAPLIPLFMVLIGDTGERMTRRRWLSLGQLSSILLDTFQGLATVKLLGQVQEQRARIARASESFRRSTLDVLRVTFLSALVLEWVAMLGTAVVAVEIGLRLLYGRLGFEPAFFVLLLAPEFYSPLRELGARFHAGMTGFEAAGRILDLVAASEMHRTGGRKAPLRFASEIRFERVSYRYPDRDREALNEIDLVLRSGDHLAIIGPSGCGKTTLTKLLLRFLEPDAGHIRADGRLLSELDPGCWRDQIAWVPQNPHLFTGSVLDNIRIGRPDASTERVMQAARAVGLHQDLLALPGGYDTQVGEQGIRLSAGQAQRVALARAFLKDAPLLILDEATAALDPLTEASLLPVLKGLLAGRTALIVTHRLRAAQLAEHVMLMNAGRIVQVGTHASLLAEDGPYAILAASHRGRP